MKHYKNLFAISLTIFTLAFIVFVGFMQHKFNNPEFSDLSTAQTEKTDSDEKLSKGEDEEEEIEKEDEDEKEKIENEEADEAAGSVVNDDENDENETDDNNTEAEEEPIEKTTSTKTALVDSLNARSGPGIGYEITGVLAINQVVEVEDSDAEWIKVITDEFTGYVNKKYLSE